MREIEMRLLDPEGNHVLVKALAVIAVVRNDNGAFKLEIRENGELTEDWWRAFPQAMQTTIEEGIITRRKAKHL